MRAGHCSVKLYFGSRWETESYSAVLYNDVRVAALVSSESSL